MAREKISVLIVDESELLRSSLPRSLRHAPATIRWAGSADEALSLIASSAPDLLVTGYLLPGSLDGFALLERVHAQHPSVRCVLHTGAHADTVRHANAFPVLFKPCPLGVLLELIESVRLGMDR